jgi:hypothetical protein
MELTKTINEAYTFGKARQIESNCIAITFINKSTSNTAMINGIQIAAGEQYKVDQQSGFLDTTIYDVIFLAGAGVNEIAVSRILIVR